MLIDLLFNNDQLPSNSTRQTFLRFKIQPMKLVHFACDLSQRDEFLVSALSMYCNGIITLLCPYRTTVVHLRGHVVFVCNTFLTVTP